MTAITPEPIMGLLRGVLAAKYLMVGTELGLFEALHRQPSDLDALADQLTMPQRTLRILADALVAVGLLDCAGGVYANSPAAATFLAGQPGPDLRPAVRMWNHVIYPQWLDIERSLREDIKTLGFADLDERQAPIFANGIEALTSPSAQALAASYAWDQHRALLDLGGGTGSFLRAIAARHPQLRCVLYEMPSTAALVRAEHADGLPFDIVEGDLLNDPLPAGFDAFLVANVIHLFSLEHTGALFRRIRAIAPADSRLLLVDYWTDASHTQPAMAALLAGEFQIVSGEGDVYSVDEIGELLAQSGWDLREHRPFPGAASLIVAAPRS